MIFNRLWPMSTSYVCNTYFRSRDVIRDYEQFGKYCFAVIEIRLQATLNGIVEKSPKAFIMIWYGQMMTLTSAQNSQFNFLLLCSTSSNTSDKRKTIVLYRFVFVLVDSIAIKTCFRRYRLFRHLMISARRQLFGYRSDLIVLGECYIEWCMITLLGFSLFCPIFSTQGGLNGKIIIITKQIIGL